MTQEYHIGSQMLETGCEYVSPHLRWLIRNLITDYVGTTICDMICYRTSTPNDEFGEAHSPSRSITLNLFRHFDELVTTVEDGDNKYTSLSCMILKELMDTVGHETHHLKASETADNWDNSKLEEDNAKEMGNYLAWRIAKKYDVEIDTFGPLLDDAISEWIEDLKADLLKEEEDGVPATEWKALQVYMYENKLAYYHPETEDTANFRKAFEIGAEDEDPWIDDVKNFIMEVTTQEIAPQNVTQPTETQPSPAAPPVSGEGTVPVVAAPAATAPTNPVVPPAPSTPPAPPAPPAPTAPTGMGIPTDLPIAPQDDGVYGETGMLTDIPQAVQHAAGMAPVAPVAPAAHATPAAPAQTAPAADVNMQAIESTLRRLFHHVQSKGEFNSEGGYNNPYVVLEPVSIADIPGAQELIVAMDTVDASGTFVGQTPCNGQIKGLVSKDLRPRYTLYLNMGGQLHKRTFISNDPNKMDAKNPGQYGRWAQAARQGTRIMMLLQDDVGIRADIQLPAGQPLGQEQWKLWEVKNNANGTGTN